MLFISCNLSTMIRANLGAQMKILALSFPAAYFCGILLNLTVDFWRYWDSSRALSFGFAESLVFAAYWPLRLPGIFA